MENCFDSKWEHPMEIHLRPGDAEGANVGSSLLPASTLISVGLGDFASLGYKLGTFDGISLGPGDAEGANVGSSLIPTSTFTSVGPEDGKSLGYKLGTFDGTSLGPGDDETHSDPMMPKVPKLARL